MASTGQTNVNDVVRASNTFAFALYKELCKEEGQNNLFFSPLSITAALAMIHLGTAGKTAEEIKTALNVSFTIFLIIYQISEVLYESQYFPFAPVQA